MTKFNFPTPNQNVVNLNIGFDAETKRELEIIAKEKGISMRDCSRVLIETALEIYKEEADQQA